MYTAKTGKKFGSAFAGRKYDEVHKEGPDDKAPEAKNPFAAKGPSKPSKAHEAKEKPAFEAGEKEGAVEAGSDTPESVVAEHGPATSVHVTHDRVAHKHHVTSVHKDGHVHESDHASPEEANQAASHLGGAGNEAPVEQAEGGAPEPDGFQMPGLD